MLRAEPAGFMWAHLRFRQGMQLVCRNDGERLWRLASLGHGVKGWN